MTKKPLIILGIVFLIVLLLFKGNNFVKTPTSYVAKVLCSEYFVAHRNSEEIIQNDFTDIHPLLSKISTNIDDGEMTVTASLFGLAKAHAKYREGAGCALNLNRHSYTPAAFSPVTAKPWPQAFGGNQKVNPRVDYDSLRNSVTSAFRSDGLNHRAILVAVDGELVFEHYADGFDQNTKLQSWSAAKSVVATLIGIGVHNNYLSIHDPLPVPEWHGDNSRENLTWDDLLRMHSGLDFNENYADTNSDVNRMLFKSHSAASVAAQSEAKHKPATHWYYSSGSSNLLSRAIGDVSEAKGMAILPFARNFLLRPLGLADTILETDGAGDFIGSSYVYATGRNWLKMGQLYLQDGLWEGKRILPEDWNDIVSSPTVTSDNQYGAHFWLNKKGIKNADTPEQREQFFPRLSEETYFFAGRDGQYVVIVPDKNMVFVRLGITRDHPVIPKVADLFGEIYDSVSTP